MFHFFDFNEDHHEDRRNRVEVSGIVLVQIGQGSGNESFLVGVDVKAGDQEVAVAA
jgi:hypothetical protein